MKKAFYRLLPLLLVCWLACAIDGVCLALGSDFLGNAGGNLVTGIFFVLFFAAGFAARKNRRLLGLFCRWAGIALGGMLVMVFALWGVIAVGGPAWLRSACALLMALLSAPTASCSFMLLPVFLWAVALVGGLMYLRKGKNQ